MPLLGRCVLLVCHDFPREDEHDFNEWYIREHMPERVLLPGFNRGRRFQSIDDGPRFLAFYECTDNRALSSEAYLSLVRDFDPRSRMFVPRFINPSRTVSLVTQSAGTGDGGTVGLLGFERDPAIAGDDAGLIDDIRQKPGITGVHLLRLDEEALNHSRKGHLRQGDLVLPWTLIVEAIDEPSLDHVWKDLFDAQNLRKIGVSKVIQRGRYRLLFGMAANRDLKPVG